MIVGTDLEETIRAHVDIERDKAPHLKAATTFYEGLAERCRKSRQTIDLFACCLDQVGLLEMRSCIETTAACACWATSSVRASSSRAWRTCSRCTRRTTAREAGAMCGHEA